jgi:hypothetical protein
MRRRDLMGLAVAAMTSAGLSPVAAAAAEFADPGALLVDRVRKAMLGAGEVRGLGEVSSAPGALAVAYRAFHEGGTGGSLRCSPASSRPVRPPETWLIRR